MEQKLLLQGGADFLQPVCRPPSLFRLRLELPQPFLQPVDLFVEPVVALLELRCGDGPLDAHLQQAVFFCPNGGQVLLDAPDILDVVVLVGNGLKS